jgi:hypothetical protein
MLLLGIILSVATGLTVAHWSRELSPRRSLAEIDVAERPTARYFQSPEEAVSTARGLIRSRDWLALATFYDLSGADIKLDSLTSGDFFFSEDAPPQGHPSGIGRYKHPFPPAFHFEFAEPTQNGEIIVVHMAVDIDQGDGAFQRGLHQFRLRESRAGYQILPN